MTGWPHDDVSRWRIAATPVHPDLSSEGSLLRAGEVLHLALGGNLSRRQRIKDRGPAPLRRVLEQGRAQPSRRSPPDTEGEAS